jgi:hypothetical protein
MAQAVKSVQLQRRTLKAFDGYVHQAESEMEQTLHGSGTFLWSDQLQQRAQAVARGKVVAEFWSGRGPVKVPSGLIHDWIAAAFLPASTIQQVFALMQDYDNHKYIYEPEVVDSRLIRRDGNDFQIYLRLLRKKLSPWYSIPSMRCIIVRWTKHVGCAALAQRELQKWKTRGGRRSELCRRIRATDSYGACIPIGDSRSAMREQWSNAEPFP